MKKCPVCSNMVDDSFAFCPHCGQKIEIVETEDNTNPSEDKTNEISQQPDADNMKEAEASPAPQDEGAAPNPENEDIKDIPATEDKQPVQEDLPEATAGEVKAQEPDAGVNPELPVEEGSAVIAQNAPVQDMLDENPLEYNPNLGGGQESEYDQSQNEYAEDGAYTDDVEGSYGNPDEPLGYEMQLIEEDDDKVNIPPKRKKSRIGLIALLLLLLAAAGAAAYYFLKDYSQGEDAAAKDSEKNVKTVKQTPDSKMPQQTDSIDDAAVKDKVDKDVSKSQDEIEETQDVISDKARQDNGGDKKGMKGIQNFENQKKKLEEGLKNGQNIKKEEKKSEKELKEEEKQRKKEEKQRKKEEKRQKKEEKKRNKNPN